MRLETSLGCSVFFCVYFRSMGTGGLKVDEDENDEDDNHAKGRGG